LLPTTLGSDNISLSAATCRLNTETSHSPPCIHPLIPHQPQITFNDVIMCYTSLSSAYNEWMIISHFLILAVINVSKYRMHR